MNGSTVVNVVVAADDWDAPDEYIEYDASNPAYIDGDYVDGYFYAPQPFASWSRSAGTWQPPTPMPPNGTWRWDEDTLSWVEVTA